VTGKRKGAGKLRPAVQRIGAFAGFNFGELVEDRDALGFGEAGNGGTLGFEAKARTTLPLWRPDSKRLRTAT
jgi:hypothetical protein